MADSNLPVGPSPPRSGGPWLRVLGVGATALLGLLLFLGFASLVGDDLRRAVLVETDVSPLASEPSFSDVPGEAARFFADRDSTTVRIPWDMTVSDFLGLYHLETNPSARAALRAQLGAVADSDVLREGDHVTLALTATRPNL